MFVVLYYKHLEYKASVPKEVRCEHCGQSFAYQLTRHTAIDVMPPLPFLVRQGEKTCRRRLARRLEQDVDPVSCPSCGWLQASMAVELQRRFLKGMRTAGLFLIYGSLSILPVMAIVTVYFMYMRATQQAMGDIDCVGLTLALLAVAPVGGLILLLRMLLAKMVYPATAFKPKRPISQSENAVMLQSSLVA